MAKIIVCFTTAPYSSSAFSEGLDFAISATNYGHEVDTLFCDNAIYLWQQNQAPVPGIKNLAKRLKSLPLFDIDNLYVCSTSAASRSVDINSTLATQVTVTEIARLLNNADHVVTF